MSDIKFIKKTLNDIFIVGRGLPKYTQSYANRNKGEYPVYSSKTENDGLFATINTYDYDGEYLTWSTDGYAGVLFHRAPIYGVPPARIELQLERYPRRCRFHSSCRPLTDSECSAHDSSGQSKGADGRI